MKNQNTQINQIDQIELTPEQCQYLKDRIVVGLQGTAPKGYAAVNREYSDLLCASIPNRTYKPKLYVAPKGSRTESSVLFFFGSSLYINPVIEVQAGDAVEFNGKNMLVLHKHEGKLLLIALPPFEYSNRKRRSVLVSLQKRTQGFVDGSETYNGSAVFTVSDTTDIKTPTFAYTR